MGRGNGMAHKFIHCTLATTVNNPHGDSVRYGQVSFELTHTHTHTLLCFAVVVVVSDCLGVVLVCYFCINKVASLLSCSRPHKWDFRLFSCCSSYCFPLLHSSLFLVLLVLPFGRQSILGISSVASAQSALNFYKHKQTNLAGLPHAL